MLLKLKIHYLKVSIHSEYINSVNYVRQLMKNVEN